MSTKKRKKKTKKKRKKKKEEKKRKKKSEAILFLEPKISMQSVQHCASRRRTRTLTNDVDRDYN